MSKFGFDNDVVGSLILYGALLILKTMLMIPATIYFRLTRGAVPSREDALNMAPNDSEKQKLLLRPNEDVERVSWCCARVLDVRSNLDRC